MDEAADDHEFAKILVNRDQHPRFGGGDAENLFIPRVGRPVACPRYVVAGLAHDRCGATGDATVQKHLHAAESTGNGSTRSCATSL